MIGASEAEESFEELVNFPFGGTFEEYMDVRFGFKDFKTSEQNRKSYISLPAELEKLKYMIKPYLKQIKKNDC